MMKISEMPKYEVYKDSGVEWIGAIPVHWNSFPFCAKSKLKSISNNENEELLSVYLDKGVIKFDDVDAKRTNTTSSDLTKYQLVDPGDFVLNNQQAWRGSVGVSDYRGIVSPAYLVLSLSEDIVPRFGNYLFRDGAMVANYLVSSKGVGTIQRNLYWPQLKRALVFLPPTEEQLLIANFLDKKTALIDEAISIKEKQINLLKEHKQIIIQQAVTQGLDPNVPMKDSGVDWIGEIPEHWEIIPLKHLCKFSGGGTPSKDNLTYWEGGTIPWVSPKDMKSTYIFETQDYVTEKAVKNSSTNFVAPNSLLLVVRSGILQRKIPVAINTVEVTLNQDMKSLTFNHHMTIEFMLNFIVGNNDSLLVEWTKEGATVESIEHEYLANGLVCVPPVSEQNAINEYLSSFSMQLESAISLQAEQIEKLKEYKTTLINSAVTGKIKITPEMVEQ
ncbi:restriction endonuclease subunit S [Escherichia coli]|nr:restriction endonuclease subunit S [Escherichia coli]